MKSCLLKLAPLLYRQKKWLACLILLILCASLLEMIFPLGIRFLFNEAIPLKKTSSIAWFFFVVLLAFSLKSFLTVLQEKGSAVFAGNIVTELREQMFRKLFRTTIGYVHERGPGEISSLFMNDLQTLYDMIQTGVVNGTASLLMAVCFLSALLVIHAPLTLVSFITVPFFIYFFIGWHRSVKERTLDTRKSLDKMNAFIIETVHLLSLVRLNNLEALFHSRRRRLDHSIFMSLVRQKAGQGVFMALVFFSILLSFALTLCAGAWLVMENRLSIGDLFAFYILLQAFFQPLMGFFVAFRSIQTGIAVFERMDHFMEDLDSHCFGNGIFPHPLKARLSEKKRLALELRDVSFAYNGKAVLKNLNLEILKGERVLIVGLNGSGKSSLVKLFLGFYAPYEGEIFVLGKNLRDWPQQNLSRIFSVVEQDTHVFRGSLRQNLNYGRDAASKAEYPYFLEGLNLKRFEGEKPVILENGKNLSAGERQRIALLRALMKEKPVYVFDEAFSSQDADWLGFLPHFMNALSPDKTFIGITHQLSNAPYADRVVVIDQGSILETGSHSDLMENCQWYRHLYSLYQKENGKRNLRNETANVRSC
ncbi:MAG: ABC transporter ATP-binding protein [Candidatus Aureabacteria bacterium]|nr:ABC transporter ATP-binding protein [Candidatus Auribacterota bacterium]